MDCQGRCTLEDWWVWVTGFHNAINSVSFEVSSVFDSFGGDYMNGHLIFYGTENIHMAGRHVCPCICVSEPREEVVFGAVFKDTG